MTRAVLLSFLALAATATFAQREKQWTHLYVKWSQHGAMAYWGRFGFHKIPLTTDEARRAGWKQAARTNLITIWCIGEDPRGCPMYDLQGYIAGMQISLPVADIVFPGNDSVDNHPLLFKNNMYNTELYSARYYLVDQATLAAGGRRWALYDEIGTGLWLQSGPDLVEVPRDGDLLEAQSWTRQNCKFAMGVHYYYNLSKEMSCEDLQPFFLLVDKEYNTLYGVGFQMIGTPSVTTDNWFEDITTSDITAISPDAPACLKNMVAKYGIISLHMYFVRRPWQIEC